MPSPLRALGAAVLLAALTGCSPIKAMFAPQRHPHAQRMSESIGLAWISGTDGLAAYTDGRTLVRRDYPLDGAPDWAFGELPYPTAHIVPTPEGIRLFTIYGEMRRWTGMGWEKVPVAWPDFDAHQLNFAANVDNRLVVQFHSDKLAWSEKAPLGKWWTAELTGEQYYTWLGPFDGALYGFGWLDKHGRRARVKRAAPGQWDLISDVGSIDPMGAIRVPGGPMAAVSRAGLWIAGEDRIARLVPAETLLDGRHPAPMAAPAVKVNQANQAARPLMVAGGAAPRGGAESEPEAPPKSAVVAAPSGPARLVWVDAVLRATGHGPLLVIDGGEHAIVEIGERTVTVTRYQDLTRSLKIIGAAETPAGLRVATRDLGLYAVEPGRGLTVVVPPSLQEER